VRSDRALLRIADIADELARARRMGTPRDDLRGFNIALLSCSAAQRRWPAFERAVGELGARVTCLHHDGVSIAAYARLLGQLYDAIDCEHVDAASVREIDRQAGIPVLHGLASGTRATRIVAMLTHLRQRAAGPLQGLRVAFTGSMRSAHGESLMRAASLAGMELALMPGASTIDTPPRVVIARPSDAPGTDVASSVRSYVPDIVVGPLDGPSDEERRLALQAMLVSVLA
jgi:ornithine carbamoyltransferase